MGQQAAPGVVADAQNLSAGAHSAVGKVVQNIGLEAAWGFEHEAGSLEAVGQAGEIVDAEFDFGLDGHRKSAFSF